MGKMYDVIVVGGGPGGYYSGIRGAQLGLKMALVEMDKLGGICANYGCIPTKNYYNVSKVLNQSKRASQFGLIGDALKPDMKAILKQKNDVVEKLTAGIKTLLTKNNVDIYTGKAVLAGGKDVDVLSENGKERISGENIILATGSVSSPIPGIAYDGKKVMASKDILAIDYIPASLLIAGGGAIGVEMACIFNSFGSKVTVVEMLPNIIPTADEEISAAIKKSLISQGIEVYNQSKVDQIKVQGDKVLVNISTPTGSKSFTVTNVFLSIGRQANIEDLDIEKAGLKKERYIQVNEKMEVSVPGIYAIGDCNGKAFFAYTASAQGLVAVETIAGGKPVYDESVIPCCIWSNPEIASVGLTEQEAKKKEFDIAVGKFPFLANGRALSMRETEGFVKVIIDKKSNRVLGAHIIGPDAANLIAEASMALRCKATVDEFDRISHAHPVLSEAVMEAINQAVGKAIDLPPRTK